MKGMIYIYDLEDNHYSLKLGDEVSDWQRLFLPTYFTIQLIFATIYRSHYTFWYYL